MDVRSEDVWVLVFDSTRARILRGIGQSGRPLPAELVLKTGSRHLLKAMSDLGRHRRPNGPPRLAPDPLGQDERQFLREVVAVLESHRRANEIHRLAVFGEPRDLALLQAALPPSLRRLVLCEMPMNLVHLSAQDLPDVVLAHLDAHR